MNIEEIQKKQLSQKKDNADLENDYPTIVVKVRETLTTKYHDEILNNFGKSDQREMLTAYIKSVVISSFSEYNTEEFIERIYRDIFGLVFIEKYLNRDDFEEMNGNSWNDIEVILKSGSFKIPEKFNSPEHAINILRKMALMGGATLDNFTVNVNIKLMFVKICFLNCQDICYT